MPPNGDIVADLHKVVDFCPLAYHGVAVGATINRAPGSNFHVILNDDAADLWHFRVRAPAQRIAKAVLAETAARMNDHPVPDQGMQNRALRADRTIASAGHARPDDGVRGHDRPGPDFRAWPDDNAWIERNAGFEPSRRMHMSARCDPGRCKHQ